MFQANIVPGQGFVKLFIHASKQKNVGGKVKSATEPTDKWIWGMVTAASQKEIEYWKQKSHPIDHVIVSSNAVNRAKATDYLIAEDGRKFYISGIDDPAGLGISVAYYVEERFDLK